MSFKLHYPMLLPIEGMMDEGGVGFTAEKASAALRAMADRLEADPSLLHQTFGRQPVASEREDRWILRSTTKPNVVRKADRSWVEVDPEDIDLADTLNSEEIANLKFAFYEADEHSVWVRPEDIGGLPVLASLVGEQGEFLGQFDLRSWLAWEEEENIELSFAAGWDFTEAVEESECDEADPLYDDANLVSLIRQDLSFTARVEENEIAHIVAFLDELRPGFIDRIGARPADGGRPK